MLRRSLIARSREAGRPDLHSQKQSSGSGQFGEIKINVIPSERGSGFQFSTRSRRERAQGISLFRREGAARTAETGSLIGFPIIDFEVHLVDGKYHDVDSSALAFEICARGAMREAAHKAGVKLLEPIMKVEVVTPEDCLGDVIGDINAPRQIQAPTPWQRADGRGDRAARGHLRLRQPVRARLTQAARSTRCSSSL